MSICRSIAPRRPDHISGLIAGFRLDEKENGLIAAGLVFDGRARSDDAAALCFHIEAANGKAVEVIVPYARRDAATRSPSTSRRSRKSKPRFSPK